MTSGPTPDPVIADRVCRYRPVTRVPDARSDGIDPRTCCVFLLVGGPGWGGASGLNPGHKRMGPEGAQRLRRLGLYGGSSKDASGDHQARGDEKGDGLSHFFLLVLDSPSESGDRGRCALSYKKWTRKGTMQGAIILLTFSLIYSISCRVPLQSLSRKWKMPDISPVYQPRKPQDSQYYQCVEDNFEILEQVYDERFAEQYGFFRPYVKQVIYRYPWPRPGLVRLSQLSVFSAMNKSYKFKVHLVAPGRARLRHPAQWLCPGEMWRMWPRIFARLFL